MFGLGLGRMGRVGGRRLTGIAALEAAAIAAAQRNGAMLLYPRPSNWIDPNAPLLNTFQHTDGAVPSSVDTLIGLMRDQGAGIYHASQGTTASKPFLRRAANGRLCTAPDVTDDQLVFPVPINFNNDYTLIAAVQQPALVAGQVFAALSFGSRASPNPIVELSFNSDGSPRFLTRDSANSLVQTQVAKPAPGAARVMSATKSGEVRRLYVGGAIEATSVPGQSAATTLDMGAINARPAQDAYGNRLGAPIFLVCAAPVSLPDADRIAIERFAAALSGAAYAV